LHNAATYQLMWHIVFELKRTVIINLCLESRQSSGLFLCFSLCINR